MSFRTFGPPAALGVAAFIAGVFLFSVSYGPLNLYDEGIILVGASRVMNGELPYKDFWSMYPPGNFYIEALLFKLFGEQAYANRLFDALTKVAIIGMCYSIFRVYLSRLAALFLAAAAMWFLLLVSFPGFPVFQATLLALVIVSILIRVDRPGQHDGKDHDFNISLFVAGAINGLIVCFRHDLAAYTLLSVFAFFAAQLFCSRDRRDDAALFVRKSVIYTLGIATTSLPLAIGLLAYAGYNDVYFSLIESPATIYPAYRSLPFPPLESLTLLTYLPFLMVISSLALLAFSFLGTDGRGKTVSLDARSGNPVLFFLAAMVALFSLKGVVRPNAVHMAPAIIMSLILVAYLVKRFPSKISTMLFAILVTYFFTVPGHKAAKKYFFNIPKFVSSCLHPQHPKLLCVHADESTVAAAEFIADLPGIAAVYVGAGMHDRIYVGNSAAYFLIGKHPASKWHELHPGIQTRADIQGQIIAELRNAQSPAIAIDTRWDTTREPNRSGESSDNHDLDWFLRDCFDPVREFGDITIYLRNTRCPR